MMCRGPRLSVASRRRVPSPGKPLRIQTRRFRADDLPALERLNQRLAGGGIPHRVFPEDLPPSADSPISVRLFVAATEQEIHGGVWLHEQDFVVGKETLRAGWAKYPVSESVIDSRFGGVPASLLMRLLRVQPRLMALGLGGHNTPFARLLSQMRWSGWTIPFYIGVARANRVLRQTPYLRRNTMQRLIANAFAVSGLGWVALTLPAVVRRGVIARRTASYDAEPITAIDDSEDRLWDTAREHYGFAAVRDSRVLRFLYGQPAPTLTLLRVRKRGQNVGWVCVTLKPRGVDDPHFGELSVGMLADGMAVPADALGVMAAAIRFLQDANVDLLVSNQQHGAWRSALSRHGFLRAPSNFAFYASPEMAALVEKLPAGVMSMHLNRGDCDGPRFG